MVFYVLAWRLKLVSKWNWRTSLVKVCCHAQSRSDVALWVTISGNDLFTWKYEEEGFTLLRMTHLLGNMKRKVSDYSDARTAADFCSATSSFFLHKTIKWLHKTIKWLHFSYQHYWDSTLSLSCIVWFNTQSSHKVVPAFSLWVWIYFLTIAITIVLTDYENYDNYTLWAWVL